MGNIITHISKTSKIFESSFTTLPLLLFRAMNANVDKIINDFFYAFLFFSILGKVGSSVRKYEINTHILVDEMTHSTYLIAELLP